MTFETADKSLNCNLSVSIKAAVVNFFGHTGEMEQHLNATLTQYCL